MKLALNGALTIGTEDGANIEIRDSVGDDNIFIFGHKAHEVAALRPRGYQPLRIYESDARLKAVLDAIAGGAVLARRAGPLPRRGRCAAVGRRPLHAAGRLRRLRRRAAARRCAVPRPRATGGASAIAQRRRHGARSRRTARIASTRRRSGACRRVDRIKHPRRRAGIGPFADVGFWRAEAQASKAGGGCPSALRCGSCVALRATCPAVLAPWVAPQNSLRSLRSLRSNSCDESVHEARCARRPTALRFSSPQRRAAGAPTHGFAGNAGSLGRGTARCGLRARITPRRARRRARRIAGSMPAIRLPFPRTRRCLQRRARAAGAAPLRRRAAQGFRAARAARFVN